jgi:alkylation response protein AidB-like acyl-CoA dehydrogenase
MAAAVDSAHAWLEALTFQMTRMTYEEQVQQLAGPIALHKLLTTRTATMVADEAAQIFGGRALTQTGMGRYCERFWRTVKFGAILGGSEEIMADLGIKQALRSFPANSRL